MPTRKLVPAEEVAARKGTTVAALRLRAERGEIEGFEVDGRFFLPDEPANPTDEDPVGWLRTWAQEAGIEKE